jgi:hypothetical protein
MVGVAAGKWAIGSPALRTLSGGGRSCINASRSAGFGFRTATIIISLFTAYSISLPIKPMWVRPYNRKISL